MIGLRSRSIFLGPLFGRCLEFGSVALVELGDFRDERVIGVGVR